MEILTPDLVSEWCRIDTGIDAQTLNMLEGAAIDVVELELGKPLRRFTDADGNIVTPDVPKAIAHAIAIYLSASYNDREAISDATMKTVRALVAPHRRLTL